MLCFVLRCILSPWSCVECVHTGVHLHTWEHTGHTGPYVHRYYVMHTYVCMHVCMYTYVHLNVHRTTLVFLLVSDGVAVCLHAGLCRKPVEMEEFSLAWKDDNSDTFINGN